MTRQLTTHVLDVSRGQPASGVVVEAHLMRGSERAQVGRAITNAQGRTDAPLVGNNQFERGVYELTFHVGDYFRRYYESTGLQARSQPSGDAEADQSVGAIDQKRFSAA